MSLTGIASAVANRRRRQEAHRLTAPQWRPIGPLTVEVISDRLLVSRGDEYGSVWLASVVGLRADALGHALDRSFDADPPFRFEGPDVPRLEAILVDLLDPDAAVAGRR